jgi:hypothetical protein
MKQERGVLSTQDSALRTQDSGSLSRIQDDGSPTEDTSAPVPTGNLLKTQAEYSSVAWHVDRNRSIPDCRRVP